MTESRRVLFLGKEADHPALDLLELLERDRAAFGAVCSLVKRLEEQGLALPPPELERRDGHLAVLKVSVGAHVHRLYVRECGEQLVIFAYGGGSAEPTDGADVEQQRAAFGSTPAMDLLGRIVREEWEIGVIAQLADIRAQAAGVLRRVRKENGLSADELASRSGVAATVIAEIESGTYRGSCMARVEEVGKAMGMKLDVGVIHTTKTESVEGVARDTTPRSAPSPLVVHSSPHPYVVVLKARAGLRIEEGKSIPIRGFNAPYGKATIVFRTGYVSEGYDVDVPRALLVEGHVNATRADEAITIVRNLSSGLGAFFAFVANAHVGELEPQIAYDATPDLGEREYFQNFIPKDIGLFEGGREVDIEAAAAFWKCVDGLPEDAKRRVHRAIVQYALALSHWRPGYETLALLHLYIAAEALAPAGIRRMCISEGITPDDLAKRWGVAPRQDGSLDRHGLASQYRLRVIFRGDEECYRLARFARTEFVHSTETFESVWKKAEAARDTTAAHIRNAVFEIAGFDGAARTTLEGEKFAKPRGATGFTRTLRGFLLGSEGLAPEGNLYPMVQWEWKLKSVTKDEQGKYSVRFDQSFTPRVGKDVTFRPTRWEVWGPT